MGQILELDGRNPQHQFQVRFALKVLRAPSLFHQKSSVGNPIHGLTPVVLLHQASSVQKQSFDNHFQASRMVSIGQLHNELKGLYQLHLH